MNSFNWLWADMIKPGLSIHSDLYFDQLLGNDSFLSIDSPAVIGAWIPVVSFPFLANEVTLTETSC